MTDEIRPGRYRHYRGREYQVYGLARHSETEEQVVIYRCLYGDFSLWVRPLELFLSPVEQEGKVCPRFELISEDPAGGIDGRTHDG